MNQSFLPSHRLFICFPDVQGTKKIPEDGLTDAATAECSLPWPELSSSLSMTGGFNHSMTRRHDLLEILEDRYNVRSTIVTSQLPVYNWHEAIGDPTLADAILDRLVHNAYQINLKGESMRKRLKTLDSNRPLG